MTDTNYITINSYKKSGYANLFSVQKEKLPKNEIESIEVWYIVVNEKDQPFYKYNLTNGELQLEINYEQDTNLKLSRETNLH